MKRKWQVLSNPLSYLAFFLVAVSIYTVSKPMTHYKGESIVTPNQAIELLQITKFEKPMSANYIVIKDDVLAFNYDFYRDNKIDYLNGKPTTPFDNVFVHAWITYWLTPYLLVFIVILWYWYFHQRKVNRWFDDIRIKIESFLDKRFPEVSGSIRKPQEISVDGQNGILCVRSWRYNEEANLISTAQSTVWNNGQELVADKRPSKDDMKGIYAFRLGASISQKASVMGIVVMDGKYESHPDGVVRAEHCKIIGLFLSRGYQKLGRNLSLKYKVPVSFDIRPEQGYLHWLYSKNGLKGLQHNFELLKEENDGNGN